jgi:hypothetical protein
VEKESTKIEKNEISNIKNVKNELQHESHSKDPMDIYQKYKRMSEDGDRIGWVVVSATEEARKSRIIFENEIYQGNYAFYNRMISEYISLAKDENISKDDRRRYLIDALWLWQRLPPKTEKWTYTNEDIPEKVSSDLDSQKRLQDIIIIMKSLES